MATSLSAALAQRAQSRGHGGSIATGGGISPADIGYGLGEMNNESNIYLMRLKNNERNEHGRD